MDETKLGAVLFVSGLVALGLLYIAARVSAGRAAANEAREEARKEIELQRQHPELWAQREMLKLEKERLAAQQQMERERLAVQQQLAEEQAKQENRRNNAGIIFGIGRGLGIW